MEGIFRLGFRCDGGLALLLQNAKLFRHDVRNVDLVFDTLEHFKFLCVFVVMLLGSLDDVLPMWTQLVLDDLENFQNFVCFCCDAMGSLHNVLLMWSQLVVFDYQT